MKIIEYRGTPTDYFGEQLHEVDHSEAYEINTLTLYEQEGWYTILEANGCSCWDGDYSGWTEMDKPELIKLMRAWLEKGDVKEKEMAAWVLQQYTTEAEVVE